MERRMTQIPSRLLEYSVFLGVSTSPEARFQRAEVETSFSGMCSGKGCPSPVVLSAN